MIGVLLIAGSALFVASLASILIWAPVAAAQAAAAIDAYFVHRTGERARDQRGHDHSSRAAIKIVVGLIRGEDITEQRGEWVRAGSYQAKAWSSLNVKAAFAQVSVSPSHISAGQPSLIRSRAPRL